MRKLPRGGRREGTGGARPGAGRPAIPRTQIKIWETTKEELKNIPGRTWNEKIQNLIKFYKAR